jgi:phosphonate transport system substrate-binding protein
MNYFNKLIYVFIWSLCLMMFLSSCGSKDQKQTLYIAIAPSADAERTNEKIDVITSYFSQQLDMPVKHVLVTNPNAVIEAMRAKKIHIGSGGPFTYLIAAEKAGARAIVTTQTPDGQTDFYRTLIIVHKSSPIYTMEDLKKYAPQSTLSWAYPTSCSGHLVPRFYLQEQGIYPENFKEVFTSTDHTSAIFTLTSGKVDVAAVYKSGIKKFVEEGRIQEDDFRVLWESPALLASPVFVRNDLDDELVEKIRGAYLNMKERSPEIWKILRAQYSFEIEYVAIDDNDFDHYREMANQIKDLGFNFKLDKK